jgi:hypothetical protein
LIYLQDYGDFEELSNKIMKKLKKNSDEGAVFYAFSICIYRGINFVDIKFKNIFPQILRR